RPPRPPLPPRALPPVPPPALALPVSEPNPPTVKPRPPLPPTERPASPAAPPRAPAGHAVVWAELVPANSTTLASARAAIAIRARAVRSVEVMHSSQLVATETPQATRSPSAISTWFRGGSHQVPLRPPSIV